jgi:hypothetical protein
MSISSRVFPFDSDDLCTNECESDNDRSFGSDLSEVT